MSLHLVPITLKEAVAFVAKHHRHSKRRPKAYFAVACADETEIRGVAIIGPPTSRMLARDEFTAEVRRVCTDGARNACSMLYGAAWRAARALGYRKLVTYTLVTEDGASLRASGYRVVAEVKAENWHRPSRPRVDTEPAQRKLRWEAA